MKVTYLGHSGFLMEWENIYCLFDYHTGTIPRLDPDKPLYVFVSHAHGDHYNRIVWELRKKYSPVYYIVSKDVPLSAMSKTHLGLTEADEKKITRVKADASYRLPQEVVVKTLCSTDAGVAFLVNYAGQTVFHAGDLNLWLWREEAPGNNADMQRRFHAEMEKLQDVSMDAAFFPLDPRQEEDCGKGLEIFNRTAAVKALFPMHFWEQYGIIEEYVDGHPRESDNIMKIHHALQEFEI